MQEVPTPEDLMKQGLESFFNAREFFEKAVIEYAKRGSIVRADIQSTANVKSAISFLAKAYDEISEIWENDIQQLSEEQSSTETIFKVYRRKSLKVLAFQWTKEMQQELLRIKKHESENPVAIQLKSIPDADAEWNWHTQQLYINNTPQGQMEVNVTDWIIKEPFEIAPKYYSQKDSIFKKTYELI
jgi:hypothetical protein